MLTVLGRNLPNLGIEIQEDKTVYIDIDHNDLNQVHQLDPKTTYIISNRTMDELETVILDGYFNIITIKALSQITTRFIAQFITTKYVDNQLRVISERMVSLYDEYGAVTNQLRAALVALRDNDAVTFNKIMSLNIYSMIDSLEGINRMVSFCKSMTSVENNYSSLVVKATNTETALSEAERYRKLYEDEKASKRVLETEIETYKRDIFDFQNQVASQTITTADIHQNAEFKSMQMRLDTISKQKEDLLQEFEEYKKDVEQQAALVGANTQNDVIKHLREELKKAQTLAFDQIVDSRMPIFQETTTLDAEHILYFKEVRPAVYINSFIKYAASLLRIKYHKSLKKNYIIIILDTLCDQFTVEKYRKRGWSINSQPSAEECVLVTNSFDYSKLKSEYHIDQRELVMIIDRTHVKTDAVQMRRAHKFYLINTVNDVADFELDPAYCIGFFAKVPAGTPATPRYLINPWDDSLAEADTRKRCGKCSSDKILSTILEETGVLPKT